MAKISHLPKFLIERYYNWKTTEYEKNKASFQYLASEGQSPKTMVISCCDSRVHVTSIFGAETGEFFIHRNIANLIPPYAPNKDYHGSSAAIEYAVKHLNVDHIIEHTYSSLYGFGYSKVRTHPQEICQKNVFNKIQPVKSIYY